jgi:hypothetical protein
MHVWGFATYFLDDGDRNFGLVHPADEDFALSYFSIFRLRGQFKDVNTINTLKAFDNR